MVTTNIETKMYQVATESCSENDTMKNMPGNVQPQDVYAALIALTNMAKIIYQEKISKIYPNPN